MLPLITATRRSYSAAIRKARASSDTTANAMVAKACKMRAFVQPVRDALVAFVAAVQEHMLQLSGTSTPTGGVDSVVVQPASPPVPASTAQLAAVAAAHAQKTFGVQPLRQLTCKPANAAATTAAASAPSALRVRLHRLLPDSLCATLAQRQLGMRTSAMADDSNEAADMSQPASSILAVDESAVQQLETLPIAPGNVVSSADQLQDDSVAGEDDLACEPVPWSMPGSEAAVEDEDAFRESVWQLAQAYQERLEDMFVTPCYGLAPASSAFSMPSERACSCFTRHS